MVKETAGGAPQAVELIEREAVPLGVEAWPRFQKKVTTSAVKIDGPFEVQTSEGPLTCKDGYLAVDARGYPYPIATEEFELIYEPVAG